jgi:hypothetical protein
MDRLPKEAQESEAAGCERGDVEYLRKRLMASPFLRLKDCERMGHAAKIGDFYSLED